MYYSVEVEGLAPGIVMNNPASMSEDKLAKMPAEKASAFRAYRKAPDHNFKKGELCVPATAIFASIIAVSSPFKITLGGKRVAIRRWFAGGASIEPSQAGRG